jgi:hypothetical protein
MRTGALPAAMPRAGGMRTRALPPLMTPDRDLPGVALRPAVVPTFGLPGTGTPAPEPEGGDLRAAGLRYGRSARPNHKITDD